MATGDKLFYSYNSPWIHNNSLKYSENYKYSMILDKTNHKIIHDGVEYGTFHNSNYISCLPSDAFINATNTFTLSPANANYFCVKVPAQASNWNSETISFDVTLSSEFGNAKYTISGKLGSGQGSGNKTWIAPRAVCVSNQPNISDNYLNNLDVRFINYRCRVVGSTHCYWPIVAIGPTTIGVGASLPTTINISNISTSLNLNSSNLSYNFIDTSANIDHKWETSLKTSLDATYYVGTTITNTLVQAQYANQLTNTVNIYGQEFNGSNDVANEFMLNSTNIWEKQQSSVDKNSYVLRTTYLRVNSEMGERAYQLYVNGRTILWNDVGIGIKTVSGTPSRKLFVHGDGNSNYSIYSENGLNYFANTVGIGVVPSDTTYMLNVNGKIWAQNGINVYGHGSTWNGTQNCGININNVNTGTGDQIIKVFCINSLKNDDVYTYWNCGIYTMKNSDRKWAYDTDANTAYNLLLYTANTTANGHQCLYAFNANSDYKGTVALNEGTAYNLVCLGVIKLYRPSAGANWAATRIAGNLNPSTITQPTASSTAPTSSTVGTSGVKITFTLSSTKYISRPTINICSAIPVINSIFYTSNSSQPPTQQIALNSGVSIANYMTIQLHAHTSTAATVNTSAVSDGIIVWGTSFDVRTQTVINNVMTNSGNGSPASIRVTLFGYYS